MKRHHPHILTCPKLLCVCTIYRRKTGPFFFTPLTHLEGVIVVTTSPITSASLHYCISHLDVSLITVPTFSIHLLGIQHAKTFFMKYRYKLYVCKQRMGGRIEIIPRFRNEAVCWSFARTDGGVVGWRFEMGGRPTFLSFDPVVKLKLEMLDDFNRLKAV